MIRKSYSAPVVKSEDVVLGVFGAYGCPNPGKPGDTGTAGKQRYGRSLSWIFRFFRW